MQERLQCVDLSAAPTPEALCAAARSYLEALHRQYRERIGADFNAETLVVHYTHQVDRILSALYRHFLGDRPTALVAIGGYGRAELFPCSDIDILLVKRDHDSDTARALERYIGNLWCLGLDIAQSVRTPAESLEDAKQHSNMLTSLIEARLIAGEQELFHAIDVLDPPLIPRWQFFADKLEEQRFNDAKEKQAGRLEPNLKTGTGGLRDIQMIGWLNRYCRTGKPTRDLEGLFEPGEYRTLTASRRTLWNIRFALHLNSRTHKDYLSFEQQKLLSVHFGYPDDPNNAGVEKFMREYYRASLSIRQLNRLATKLTEAELGSKNVAIEALDQDFILSDQQLDLRDRDALVSRPELLWRIFIHLLNNTRIKSISARLARQLRKQCDEIINKDCLCKRQVQQIFLDILNHGGNVYLQLRRMHRYGILGRYLPGFEHATGLMQFDLFHEYTVDQHTLRLIYFLDRFKHFQPDYPGAHKIMSTLRYPAILYLAALFHDLGKGHQGDHSEIGAAIAARFAERNTAIDAHDAKLLVFLVKNHLRLSTTAQKKDLSDPAVIAEFAGLFDDSEQLDYLYLLTLADISATNGTLWNNWRANLVYTLYRLTRNALNAFTPSIVQQLNTLKRRTLEYLDEDPGSIESLWDNLPETFFLNELPLLIAKKTRALLTKPERDFALHLRNHPPQIFIAAHSSPDILFARVSHFIEKNSLDIVEARLYSDNQQQRVLQQYTLDDTNAFDEPLRKRLNQMISGNIPPRPLGPRFVLGQLQHFDADTRISYHQEPQHRRTVLELSCKDRHGLLSIVSRVLLEHQIHLVHAKIATFGECVEDTFYLTNNSGSPIADPDALNALTTTLKNALEQ